MRLTFISVLGALALWSQPAISADLKASNTVKIYEGANGETVTLLEVNDSKEMLVKLVGVGGEWEGKTFLWKFDDQGQKKEVFFEKKKGSKKTNYYTMVFRDGDWTLFPPENQSGIPLSFSKKESKKITSQTFIQEFSKTQKGE